MKITIVCAGKIKEKYLSAGIAEFLKRLKPYAQVEIREIHEEKMQRTRRLLRRSRRLQERARSS